MKRFCAAAAAGLLTLSVATQAIACAPPPYHADFSKHRVEAYTGAIKDVDFASHPIGAALTGEQKEKIQASVKLGANFAGEYRLVQFRCGDKCTRILVVSLKTGRIHAVPVEGYHIADYRQFSKFLVVRSMDDRSRVQLFVFDGGAFRPTQAAES
jgi:hypothetical protein